MESVPNRAVPGWGRPLPVTDRSYRGPDPAAHPEPTVRRPTPPPADLQVDAAGTTVERPPLGGAGSGADAWAAYIRYLGGTPPEGSSRDQLVELADQLEPAA